jgi:glycosyltransferase involved in cell wall biosynthesis
VRIALLDPPSFTPPYDHALAAALARRGNEVHLLASPLPVEYDRAPNGYRRHDVFLPVSGRLFRRRSRSRARLLVKGIEYVPSVRLALRRLEALSPELVHVQWLGAVPYDVRWLRSLAARRPVVLTAHDVAPRRRANLRGWWEALQLADRVVVHSESAVEKLVAAGVPRERLVRIPHAVFDPPPGHVPTEPSGQTLLFFGLLRAYKGLDDLLRALPLVAREVPGVRLVVAGEPFDPPEPFQALAREVGVADRVDWDLRFVPVDEIPALFDRATLAVCPYRDLESSGVLATALGLGRPAVVSNVGSLGQIVGDFRAGRVVPPGDPEELAAACVELLADTAALAEAAAGARAAREALSWDAVASEHERLYEAVLAERSA